MPRLTANTMKAARAIGGRDYHEAIRLYMVHLEAHPDDDYVMHLVAQCYVWLEEDEKAIEWGSQALALETDFIPTLEMLSGCYHRMGDHDRAYQCVCRALLPPPLGKIELPGFIYTIFGLLSKIPRFRKALDPDRMRAGRDRVHNQHVEWRRWADNYKEWYEASRGGPPTREPVR